MKNLFIIALITLESVSAMANEAQCDKSISGLISTAKALQVVESLSSMYGSIRFPSSRDIDSYRDAVESVKKKKQELRISRDDVKRDCSL